MARGTKFLLALKLSVGVTPHDNVRLTSSAFTSTLIIDMNRVIGANWYWQIDPVKYEQTGLRYTIKEREDHDWNFAIIEFSCSKYHLTISFMPDVWQVELTFANKHYNYNTLHNSICWYDGTYHESPRFIDSINGIIDRLIAKVYEI